MVGFDLDDDSREAIQSRVACWNKEGMALLSEGNTILSLEKLRKSEQLCSDNPNLISPGLLSITLNNLGCYYRKTKSYHAALSYLKRSLQLDLSSSSGDFSIAGTHLNVCAVLSKLRKHDNAILHAMCALELLLNHTRLQTASSEEYQLLAIAYFNCGAENEHLRQYDKAIRRYQQGGEVARDKLGADHPLTLALVKAEDAANKTLNNFRRRRGMRKQPIEVTRRPKTARETREPLRSSPYAIMGLVPSWPSGSKSPRRPLSARDSSPRKTAEARPPSRRGPSARHPDPPTNNPEPEIESAPEGVLFFDQETPLLYNNEESFIPTVPTVQKTDFEVHKPTRPGRSLGRARRSLGCKIDKQKEECITKLQSAWRGFAARIRYQRERARRTKEPIIQVLRIQRYYRRFKAYQRAKKARARNTVQNVSNMG